MINLRNILVVEVQRDSLYDESGVMCYTYGNMGKVTQETRIYALPFLSSPVALSTQFTYDSWGRILNITYPDNEVVNYAYDLGGQLQSIYNRQVPSYTYLDSVLYDRFGAKVSQKYGNGLKTNYTYDSYTRRLTGITTMDGNSQLSSFAYTYDPVGNVTQVASTCPWLNSQTFSETFTYDASDQLTAAEETQSRSYRLDVTYGDWGRVSDYALTRTDMQDNSSTSDAYSFTYPANPSGVQGAQTMFAPESQTGTTGAQFTFGINGSLRKREVTSPDNYTEYYLFNSAANLKAYSNNGLDFAYYGYNAANTRSYKLSMLNLNQWVNGQPFPLHFLCWLKENEAKERAFRGGGKNPVHHARQLAERRNPLRSRRPSPLPCYGRRIFSVTPQVGEMTYTNREIQRIQLWQDATVSSEVPPCNLLFSFLCFVSFIFSGRRKKERNEGKNFYYHTNHLGSTAFVTDQNQTITQGFLYAPFGEITTEYNATFGNDVIPKYSFNAKELDEETGMYYYEARYYKPPVFTSRDAMFEKKPWLSPYHYCSNNPVGRVDPSGMLDEDNPVFTSDGIYLGCTKEGYTGTVLICDAPLNISEFTADELLSQAGGNLAFTYDDVRGELSNDAKSNIWTNIVSQWEGRDVYGETFSMGSMSVPTIVFQEKSDASWTTHVNSRNYAFYITGSDRYNYETTVENIQCSVIFHEWFGHGKMKYDNNFNHSCCYETIVYSDLFSKTTERYQRSVFNKWNELYIGEQKMKLW